jgi:hypothetical protein
MELTNWHWRNHFTFRRDMTADVDKPPKFANSTGKKGTHWVKSTEKTSAHPKAFV